MMDGSIVLGGLILVSLGQLLVLRAADEGTKAPFQTVRYKTDLTMESK